MQARTVPILAALFVSLAATPAARSEEPRLTSQDSSYSIFMLVQATPNWLALEPKARFGFLDTEIQSRLAEHPEVTMRFWDVEHMSARVSDVILFQTQDLQKYRSLIEGIRETLFWGHYFEVLEILPGIENAYAEHYDVKPYGADRDD